MKKFYNDEILTTADLQQRLNEVKAKKKTNLQET